jgi:asparagine synthase (glutamine-hydrolysing)
MSAIAGIWNLDGEPASDVLLRRMTAAKGVASTIDGDLAMSHRMLCTTPESLHETQPLWDESGGCCVVMDGRIDNRQELAAALPDHAVLRDDTDAELLLKAYLAWGEGAPARLAGDFAFVVWDNRRHNLFCGRDHLGIRPFYYYTNNRLFLWASDIHALLRHPAVPSRPNEHMIAELLGDCVSNQDETLHIGIRRLPPACSLTVQRNALRVSRYWDPPQNRLQYRRESDYTDHLRTLLTEAVRCRLRAPDAVAAELSGGLDSSTVVTLAKPLSDAMGVRFEAFSMVFPGLPCDESEFIDAVAAGGNVTKVTPAARARWVQNAVRRFRDFPGYPNGEMHASLWQSALHRGYRVMLTGIGGDEWFGGFAATGPFDLVRARFATASALRTLFRKHPLLPWMNAQFARRINLSRSHRMCSAASRNARAFVRCGQRVLALEIQSRLAASMGVELRHPFNDVRVVSFAARLPHSQLLRNGEIKWILREAMRGILPEIVRIRRSKAEFSHVFVREMGAFGPGVFDWSPLVRLGYLDQPGFATLWSDMLRACQSGAQDGLPHAWPLWNAYALNVWLAAESHRNRVRQDLAA